MIVYPILQYTKKSAGLNCLAYPVYLGLRIAHQPRISNVEAHAVMKYYSKRYTMYIIPMDVGHRVIMRLVFLKLRSSSTPQINV